MNDDSQSSRHYYQVQNDWNKLWEMNYYYIIIIIIIMNYFSQLYLAVCSNHVELKNGVMTTPKRFFFLLMSFKL